MHDLAAAVSLSVAAAVIQVVLGTRTLLALTGRTAGRRMRALIGLEANDIGVGRHGIGIGVGFSTLAQLLVLVVLFDNANRPDGGVAAAIAAIELAFLVMWSVAVIRVAERSRL